MSSSGKKACRDAPKHVAKQQIEILSQLVDDENGSYRVRAGHRVHYLTIPTNVFDEDTMCRPYLLIPKLPPFPDTDWTTMRISRAANGALRWIISHDTLPAIHTTWHPHRIDVLSLKQTHRHRSNVHEVLHNGRPAIAKIACFKWDLPRIQVETQVYSTITNHQRPGKDIVAPTFLGHLTENGRVIGLLLEKVAGDFASIQDLPQCKKALGRVHGMGLIHGDVNRYNFLVERSKGPDRSKDHVWMVDFEHAENFDKEKARLELESLASQLAEETGRGGPAMLME